MSRSPGRSSIAQAFVGVLVVGMIAMMLVNFRFELLSRGLDVRRDALASAEGSANDAAELAGCEDIYRECEAFLDGPGRLLALTGRDCGPPCAR